MRLRLVSRIAALCALAAIAVAIVVGLLVPAGHNVPTVVTVGRGDSVSTVAAMLRQDDLIRSAPMFTAAAYLSGKWRRIQAGTFPGPVKLSARVTAWRAEDLRRWIEQQGIDG